MTFKGSMKETRRLLEKDGDAWGRLENMTLDELYEATMSTIVHAYLFDVERFRKEKQAGKKILWDMGTWFEYHPEAGTCVMCVAGNLLRLRTEDHLETAVILQPYAMGRVVEGLAGAIEDLRRFAPALAAERLGRDGEPFLSIQKKMRDWARAMGRHPEGGFSPTNPDWIEKQWAMAAHLEEIERKEKAQ